VKKIATLLLFIAVFIITVTFSVLNFHSVQINLVFYSLNLPLTIVLFVGIAIGFLIALLQILKLKFDLSQLSKKIADKSTP